MKNYIFHYAKIFVNTNKKGALLMFQLRLEKLVDTRDHLKKTGRNRKAIRVGKNGDRKMNVRLFVRHTVADYDKWKVVFEEVEPFRKQSGSSDAYIYRGSNNPNEVMVVTYWDRKEDAMKFGSSSELRNAMQRGGVISEPVVDISES